MNCVLLLLEFLLGLCVLCDEFGVLLIIDEVMIGFCVVLVGVQDYYGVELDFICLGKIIGGGMLVGVFGGCCDVMDVLVLMGLVYQVGMFFGNLIVMVVGFVCLNEVVQLGVYEMLDELILCLVEGLLEVVEEVGILLVVNYVGGMFGIFFIDVEFVMCYQDVMVCDVERFKCFFYMMLDEGVYLVLLVFEVGFMFVVYSMEDINNIIDVVCWVFVKL